LPERVWRVRIPLWSERERAPFPTRRAEYHFVADALYGVPRGLLIDVGAGFNPEIHLMPEIAGLMDFDVIAIDTNVSSLVMPWRLNVVRFYGDGTHLPNLDATAAAWVCVSTLEHMAQLQRVGTVREAFRILRPGGVAVATADEFEPAALNDLFAFHGFKVGPEVKFEGEHLSPRVSWGVFQKPEAA